MARNFAISEPTLARMYGDDYAKLKASFPRELDRLIRSLLARAEVSG